MGHSGQPSRSWSVDLSGATRCIHTCAKICGLWPGIRNPVGVEDRHTAGKEP